MKDFKLVAILCAVMVSMALAIAEAGACPRIGGFCQQSVGFQQVVAPQFVQQFAAVPASFGFQSFGVNAFNINSFGFNRFNVGRFGFGFNRFGVRRVGFGRFGVRRLGGGCRF